MADLRLASPSRLEGGTGSEGSPVTPLSSASDVARCRLGGFDAFRCALDPRWSRASSESSMGSPEIGSRIGILSQRRLRARAGRWKSGHRSGGGEVSCDGGSSDNNVAFEKCFLIVTVSCISRPQILG